MLSHLELPEFIRIVVGCLNGALNDDFRRILTKFFLTVNTQNDELIICLTALA